MKTRLILLVMVFGLMAGCGYSQRDGEMIGQVKKVVRNTPMICPEYKDADISLGVLRGGVGSMSTQDVWVVITDKTMEDTLRKANESGALVKIKYDEKRFAICTGDKFATSVEITQ